jgi:two-component system nitrogen regulation sensor histidine kinase NtrY
VRLQSKLTVAFAAVALLPIVALTIIARLVVVDLYRDRFKQQLANEARRVEDEYRRLQSDVEQATARLASTEEAPVRRLLFALAKGPLDEDSARTLVLQAPGEMRAVGLDILELVDARGEILASGHFRGHVGDTDPEALARARRAPGRARLVHDEVLDQGRAQPVLALEAAIEATTTLDGGHTRLVVVGGRILGQAFIARLNTNARLYAPDGTLLAASAPRPPSASWPRHVIELPGSDGQPAARVEIAVSNEDLAYTLALITWLTGAFIVGALLLALLVGAGLARRISGPLRELSEGARAVSRGTLDATVPVRTRDEVGELAATFNTMTNDLVTAREQLVRAERVAAWREIAQRIAHEIKNPLTPIQMAIETLQRAQKKGAAKFDALFVESAQTILDEVARLKHIVAEFSSFARMPQPQLAPVDLSELVDGALGLYKGGDTRLELSLARDLPPARADREQITQVVINLVENARDALAIATSNAIASNAGAPSNGPGAVRVITRRSGDRVELEVADDGPGLSDEARARLFTPYFTTKARGTGLGLAIVHRIVSDHGGEIRVGGAVGQGAVFTISLPIASRATT